MRREPDRPHAVGEMSRIGSVPRVPYARWILACLAWAMALQPPDAGAQSGSIELERVGELQLLDAPAMIRPSSTLATRMDGGLFALATMPTRASEILLFNGDGTFQGTLGRAGGGPGEYAWIRSMAFDVADSLWVLDIQNQRMDVYDPELALARTMRLTGDGRAMVRMPGGGVAVAATGLGSDQDRMGIHLVVGEEVETIFIPRGPNPRDEIRITAAPPDHFWIASRFSYGFRLMERDGSVAASIGAESRWWEESRADPSYAGLMDVDPSVGHLSMDAHGHLWVSMTIPTPSPEALDLLERGATDIDPDLLASLTEGVVQVLDATTGEVLAERRANYRSSPPRTLLFVDSTLGYSWERGGPGDLVDWRLVLWRYGLHP